MKIDEYLVPNASLNRLIADYQKHNSLVIAFDFDNTVYDFHKKGTTYEMVIQLLQRLSNVGCLLICWTANSDLAFINKYLEDNNIPCDLINENPSFVKEVDIRKIYYNALLDDRAGLIQVYSELEMFCTWFETVVELT